MSYLFFSTGFGDPGGARAVHEHRVVAAADFDGCLLKGIGLPLVVPWATQMHNQQPWATHMHKSAQAL